MKRQTAKPKTTRKKQVVKKLEPPKPAPPEKVVAEIKEETKEPTAKEIVQKQLEELQGKLAEVEQAEVAVKTQLKNLNDRKQQLYGAKFNLEALVRKL